MHKVRATKVRLDGYTFDSKKEALFYVRYIRDSGLRYEVHPRYEISKVGSLYGYNFRRSFYTPDFVVYGEDGKIKHVFDVKNGFSTYAVDAAAKLRFSLFAAKYGEPVQCVVLRAHDFKSKIFGITTGWERDKLTSLDYTI